MKKLKIKTEEEETAKIELVEGDNNVDVLIDGEIIARFCNDGKCEFFGQSQIPKYIRRWDE